MHQEILTKTQVDLLPVIKSFSKDFYMVGGTAIALHIGHRRSIDFDLFSNKSLKRTRIKNVIRKQAFPIQHVLYEDTDQLHLIINDVKLTFFHYPYPIPLEYRFEDIINIPSLIDLAAMKANAIGRRGKWKDYVDLYHLIRDHYSLLEISARAKEIFKNEFNTKLFRQQLCYFDDVDFSETVDYIGEAVGDNEIKFFLTDTATIPF